MARKYSKGSQKKVEKVMRERKAERCAADDPERK